MIHYKKDYQNIATLTFDMKERSVNIINHEVAKSFIPVLELLEKEANKKQLAGVILTSAKRSFLGGGDLDYLHNSDNVQLIFDFSMTLNQVFRRLETLGVPVVAAIAGAALGSGYELTLACHYRIALDAPNTVVGLPEVNMGMIPGGGAIMRLTWMLGIEAAFEILTKGKQYHVKEALRKGLVDVVAKDQLEMMQLAHQFILSKPNVVKLWDSMPEPPPLSNPKHPQTANLIVQLNAQTIKTTRNNQPAIKITLNSIYECMQVSFEQAMKIVSRHFTALVLSAACRNMTKAFWYDLNKIKNGYARPKGYGKFRPRKIGIIGSGAMGSGISYIAALNGIEVVLKDISVSIAQQGKETAKAALNNLVQQGKMTKELAAEIIDRIQATDKFTDFEQCDLILEAVFENKELKGRVVREAEMFVSKDTFMASNSATLSITALGKYCTRPENFIGMHFFAPVAQSQLVEIVVGAATNTETLARAFDFIRAIGKVPIVVKDSPGFFAARVCRTYILEAMALLQEGQAPTHIRNAALQSGMQEGPFTMADEISLPFILELEEKYTQYKQQQLEGKHPALTVLQKMVLEFKRQGKTKQGGFYEYGENDEKVFWTGLMEHFPVTEPQLPTEDIVDRLLFVQCIEAAKCLEENIIQSSADANLGSIYGWGFPAFRGGAIQFINDYGVSKFTKRAQELEHRYGKRFALPQILLDMDTQQLNFM